MNTDRLMQSIELNKLRDREPVKGLEDRGTGEGVSEFCNRVY